MGIESTAMSNAAGFMFRKLLGSDEEFNWDMVAKNDTIGDMIGKYVTESFMSPEQIAERDRQEREAAEKQKDDFADMDFMDRIEHGIGGIFLSMKEDFGKTLQDAGKAVKDIGRGAGKLFDAVGSYAKSAWEGVTEAASYAANAVNSFAGKIRDGVTDIAQRTGNLFTEGHFATNGEMERIRQEEIAASFRNMMAYTESRLDSGSIYADASKMGPNGDFMPVYDKNGMRQVSEAEFDAAMKRANVDPALAEKYKKAYYSESEQSMEDGNNKNTFSPEVLSQDPGGSLSQMFQKLFGYGPTQADRLAGSACMANATYTALRMSGANVGTEEEFYRNHLGTDIDSETGWLNTSTADIAKQYGKEQIPFYDYDRIGEEDFKYGKATFEKWSDEKGKYIEHTVTINKDSNGVVRIFSDTGRGCSGNNGMWYKDLFTSDKFKRFQYIKK